MNKVIYFLTIILLLSFISFAEPSDTEWDPQRPQQNATPSNWDAQNGIYYTPPEPDEEGADAAGIILLGVISVIVVGSVVVYFTLKAKKKKAAHPAPRQSGLQDRSTAVTEMRPLKEYLRIDPDFSEEEFCRMIALLFLRLQKCRAQKDVSSLGPYMSDDLYAHFVREIGRLNKNEQTIHLDDVKVKNVVLRGYKPGKMHYHLILRIEASMLEYTTGDKNRRVVSGSKKRVKEKKYEWNVRRRINTEDESKYSGSPWKIGSIKSLGKTSSK